MDEIGWYVDKDVLHYDSLRIAIQRIALAYWRPRGILRSWGIAPLYPDGPRLFVPCSSDQALWLGAWFAGSEHLAIVELSDVVSRQAAYMILPHDYQLAVLNGNRPSAPISLAPGQSHRNFELRLECGQTSISICLELLPPATWTARSGRVVDPLSDKPPTYPPLLG
jgi:hypothetical protein